MFEWCLKHSSQVCGKSVEHTWDLYTLMWMKAEVNSDLFPRQFFLVLTLSGWLAWHHSALRSVLPRRNHNSASLPWYIPSNHNSAITAKLAYLDITLQTTAVSSQQNYISLVFPFKSQQQHRSKAILPWYFPSNHSSVTTAKLAYLDISLQITAVSPQQSYITSTFPFNSQQCHHSKAGLPRHFPSIHSSVITAKLYYLDISLQITSVSSQQSYITLVFPFTPQQCQHSKAILPWHFPSHHSNVNTARLYYLDISLHTTAMSSQQGYITLTFPFTPQQCQHSKAILPWHFPSHHSNVNTARLYYLDISLHTTAMSTQQGYITLTFPLKPEQCHHSKAVLPKRVFPFTPQQCQHSKAILPWHFPSNHSSVTTAKLDYPDISLQFTAVSAYLDISIQTTAVSPQQSKFILTFPFKSQQCHHSKAILPWYFPSNHSSVTTAKLAYPDISIQITAVSPQQS